MTTSRDIEMIRLPGRVAYAEAYARMAQRRDAVAQGEARPALFLLEHQPVITLGRNFKAEHLLLSEEALAEKDVQLARVDRGGDATYHGPGQLVAYPVLELSAWDLSIRGYLRALEDVVIGALQECELDATRIEGLTGVWVNGAKVAAIGVGIRCGVTYHGVALNVDPNFEHFSYIIPCGIADKPVTSLRALLGDAAPTFDETATLFERHFRQRF